MINLIIHILILLLVPPLLLGIINKTKAWFAGRKGVPYFQTYYDIIKLLRKGMVLSTTTTWIFVAAPIVTLISVLLAGILVPFGPFPSPISFAGDVILFAYLFGLARFFTTTAALDTGSAFEGMGSAREVTFACLTEPALFFAFLVLAKISGSFQLTRMLLGPEGGFTMVSAAPLVLIAVGVFIVLLAETCRIPVDDPNTHLELTMIHEVMVLDHSGPLLGVILYASSLKFLILGSLLLHIIFPIRPEFGLLNWPLFIIELFGLAIVVGIIESIMARLRMRNVSYLLIGAILFCGFGFILLVR